MIYRALRGVASAGVAAPYPAILLARPVQPGSRRPYLRTTERFIRDHEDSARDVYTGRVLWRHESKDLLDDNWLVYYDESYDEEHPLDPKYNQEHLPGSNARGTNYIATKEFVYLIEGNKCKLIDINTGVITKVFSTDDYNKRKLLRWNEVGPYFLMAALCSSVG